MIRKIIHIDMDAFYASIEQRDNPELRGKPVAVGSDKPRGVVAAASYEARRFGVHSAIPSVTARKKCPSLIFVQPRFDVYKAVSDRIMDIFLEYTDLVEPLSLDEAFLDVTVNRKAIVHATEIAKEIKEKIKAETGLTASAGVSVNKFLAKIASDYKKPDGLYVIKPDKAEMFVEKLEIEKFFGIGRVTAEKMHKMGINLGKDLKKYSLADLQGLFGKSGIYYYDIVRGVDNRPVMAERKRKSVGVENTFETDLITMSEVLKQLSEIAEDLIKRSGRHNMRGRTLTLKVKFDDFEQITRSKSYQELFTPESIRETSVALARSVHYRNKGVRLLGLAISNFENRSEADDPQLELQFRGE